MTWRWGVGIAALLVSGAAVTACSGGLEGGEVVRPISVKPNEGPVVAGESEFLVSTGDPGRPTNLVKVGIDGQVDWPADQGMIAGTQLEDGSWFILNSACQGSSGVCGDVGGIALSADGEVVADDDLWDEPGTYQVVGSSGSLVLVSARTDTVTTAYWVDARTAESVGEAYRSAPYDAAAIRDEATAAGGTEEYDTPRFRFCAGDDAAYVLSSSVHLGSTEPPSRIVEVIPSPKAEREGKVARPFEVDIDDFDARLAGALMCSEGSLTGVTVGPSADGGSEITLSTLDIASGESVEESVASYDTPLVDLYGGGNDRALVAVAELGDLSDVDSEDTDADISDELPSELVVITDAGDVIEVGPQAPTGPAVISLDGTTVLQPDDESVQVDRIG